LDLAKSNLATTVYICSYTSNVFFNQEHEILVTAVLQGVFCEGNGGGGGGTDGSDGVALDTALS